MAISRQNLRDANFSFWLLPALFLLLFLLLYPKTLLIADELAYFEQALSICRGQLPFELGLAVYKPYPIGTALWISPFIFLFGKQGAFLAGPAALLLAFFFTRRFLKKAGYPGCWAALCFFYPPALLLSRQLMSELPSLLLVSVFTALLLGRSRYRLWGLGLLTGVSLLFREANLLLLAPLLADTVVENRGKEWQAALGLTMGLALRLAAAAWAYGNPFFIKDPNVGFGLSYLPGNLLLYMPALLVFLPGGLWAVWAYKGAYARALKLAIGGYLLLHLFYGYNGCEDSGWRCLILGPRYFIPALPLFALALAGSRIWERWLPPRRLAAGIGALAVLVILAGQLGSYWYGRQQYRLIRQLYRHPEAVNVIEKGSYLHFKYVSALYGDLNFYAPEEAGKMAGMAPVYAHCLLTGNGQPRLKEWRKRLEQECFEIHDSMAVDAVSSVRLVTYIGRVE